MSDEELRRRLEHAERRALVADLAAAMAHEIKNPLGPIRGYAQMLLKRLESVSPDDRARFQQGLEVIVAESHRIEDRVMKLLRAARETHTESAERSEIPVARVVHEAVALMRGRSEDAERLELSGTIPDESVFADADDLHSAIVNLVDNALQATLPPGRVVIQGRLVEREVWIEILDEGPGFPAEVHELMKPYVSGREDGTGLGLAIARAAVESGGGSLELEPRKSKGSCARLRLRIVN